ncbi:competence/damage-inducible protein A [Pelagibacteraceae bacterium]|nr:competence/damage-inducible protein A [Pelagibacteraceae bacterium]
MQKKKKISAGILIIGNEVLSGRTQDLNVLFISNWLNNNCGISVNEVRIIPDIKQRIIFNVKDLSKKFSYVFTTGGIGPTHDDITSSSIASAFKVKHQYNKEAYLILEKYYGKKKFNISRKKMAKIPDTSLLIHNPSSAAPGFLIKNVFCLPGVPSILRSMFPNIKKYIIKGPKTLSSTINLLTYESKIALGLEKIQKAYLRKKVEIGSYPFFKNGKVSVAIVSRSIFKKHLLSCETKIKIMARNKNIKILKN